jgi:hypothetical protein
MRRSLGRYSSLTDSDHGVSYLSGGKELPVRRAENLPPSVSRLSRQCGILNISQPYRSPRPVTGITSLYIILKEILFSGDCCMDGKTRFNCSEHHNFVNPSLK